MVLSSWCTCQCAPEAIQGAHGNLVHLLIWSGHEQCKCKVCYDTKISWCTCERADRMLDTCHVVMRIGPFDEDEYAKFLRAYRCHGARAKICQKHFMINISWCRCESSSETFHGAHVHVVATVQLQPTLLRKLRMSGRAGVAKAVHI